MIKSVVYRRILLIYPTKGNGSICHPELFAIKNHDKYLKMGNYETLWSFRQQERVGIWSKVKQQLGEKWWKQEWGYKVRFPTYVNHIHFYVGLLLVGISVHKFNSIQFLSSEYSLRSGGSMLDVGRCTLKRTNQQINVWFRSFFCT